MFTGSLYKASISKNIVSLDVTPNSVNWTDAYGSPPFVNSNTQTITGIDTNITLEITFTTTSLSVLPIINSVVQQSINSGATISIANNDTLAFRLTTGGGGGSTTLTIKNLSDNNTIIDTLFMFISSDEV